MLRFDRFVPLLWLASVFNVAIAIIIPVVLLLQTARPFPNALLPEEILHFHRIGVVSIPSYPVRMAGDLLSRAGHDDASELAEISEVLLEALHEEFVFF